ncbi:MAG: DUF4837 family protein [Bacteroidaceae bacterium]|nr:DUF4837 family protein [Bacteroidaceae bacterium]MBQ6085319.1 DUF4837 family protein [Bacteroidaceae bacterium]
MKKTIPILIILATMILSGCKKGMIFPIASGRPYEVLVVMDTKTWEAPTGRALFNVLDTDVPGLPQSERSFHISQIEPQHFSANLNIFRNIIQVNIDGKQFTQTRMKFMRDKYAMDQIVLTINSPSDKDFQDFCKAHSQDIVDFLTKMEMNRLVKELEKEYSKCTYDLAWEIFNCRIHVPKELASYKKGENFLWTSNNTATGMENICMYSYPYEGPETFNKEYILHKRDSVMEKNLPGEKPGMYMQTDTLCTMIKPIVVHGMYAMETRGLWIMKDDCMGGPFVSHSRVDTEANKVLVVEGFVYAPEKMKRGLMRRLEGSLYTLMLPEEQDNMSVVITPGIDEEVNPAPHKR